MKLTDQVSQRNFKAFLWHAAFLALAKNFMDVDTIIPAMVIDAGGNSVHIGLLTAILVGVSKMAQFFFAPWLQNKERKKGYLLLGVNTRVFSLLGMALLFFFSGDMTESTVLLLIFFFITIFSVSGSFSNISYTDILGKSIWQEKRKSFFSIRQVISNIGVFVSALLAAKILLVTGYPSNYSILFFIAAGCLLVASLGFWYAREIPVKGLQISGVISFFSEIRREFRTNRKFVHYLWMVNTLGISITLLPFLVLYAKEVFDAGNDAVGGFLLFKVAGSVLAGAVLFYGSSRITYQSMLYVIATMSFLMPVLLFLLPSISLFFLLFIAGGIIFAMEQVVVNGVLLEVSSNQNRAFYAGLAGVGNILPALFPLLSGWVISVWGFPVFFGIYMGIIAASYYFIYRLDCKA
ncbi:MAG: MFS transporter [Cyclonatronaceae bacterium]